MSELVELFSCPEVFEIEFPGHRAAPSIDFRLKKPEVRADGLRRCHESTVENKKPSPHFGGVEGGEGGLLGLCSLPCYCRFSRSFMSGFSILPLPHSW